MQHVLPRGKEVLDALEQLGIALGYEVRREQQVGRSRASVDLAWSAGGYSDVPLFIFEVESSASASMQNNIVKVFGRPTEELPKPLFLFHVVLRGGVDNNRIEIARTYWGQHNYGIYRFHIADERKELVLRILTQHRRVRREVRPADVAGVLSQPPWAADGELAIVATRHLERLKFFGPYLRDYGLLALRDERYLPDFARRARLAIERRSEWDALLTEQVERDPDDIDDGYGDAPGIWSPGLLEIALRIYAGDVSDANGPTIFERTATQISSRRLMDSKFGWNRDYDDFVFWTGPYHYAWAAAALVRHPRSLRWIVSHLIALVENEHTRVRPPYSWPAIAWSAHLLIALPEAAPDGTYQRLQQIVVEGGGIPLTFLLTPPGPLPIAEDDSEWWARLEAQEPAELPVPSELRRAVRKHGGTATAKPGWMRCLGALVADELYAESGRDLVQQIHAR